MYLVYHKCTTKPFTPQDLLHCVSDAVYVAQLALKGRSMYLHWTRSAACLCTDTYCDTTQLSSVTTDTNALAFSHASASIHRQT